MTKVQLLGYGSKAPSGVLDNKKLESLFDTSAEWIETNVGIKERRILGKDESIVTIGEDAAREAIENALPRIAIEQKQTRTAEQVLEKIRFIICGTNSPPELYPSTAVKIQERLGLKECFSYDLQAGCSGWLAGISAARGYFQNLKDDEYVLVVGSDSLSSKFDYHDRAAILYGDGAGAALLGKSSGVSQIIDVDMRSVYSDSLALQTPYSPEFNNPDMYEKGGRPTPVMMHPQSKSKSVLKLSIEKFQENIEHILARNNMKKSDIQYFIPHQTNIRAIQKFCEILEFPFEKVPITLVERGCISTAGLPTHMCKLQKTSPIQPGDIVLFWTFGAGFTYGSMIAKY